MPRPTKEVPASSTLVAAALRHAEARGVDVEALRWRFGLPTDVASREVFLLAADAVDEIFEAVAVATAEWDVGLRVAAELGGRRLRLAELAVRASADLRGALARLARWTPLLHEGLHARLVETPGDEARFVIRTPRRPRGLGRHVQEIAVAYPVLQIRAGGSQVPLQRAWFAHPRPRSLEGLAACFGTTELAFGCEDSGFEVSPEVLDAPMAFADARTVEAVEPLIDAELPSRAAGSSLAERVAVHLAASFPRGADVDSVARAMRMSARTLQRRLEEEGTRFSEVLDRARLEAARRLLSDPSVALTEVALRLGFSDVATLSRAFKRWTGVPPGQWRRS